MASIINRALMDILVNLQLCYQISQLDIINVKLFYREFTIAESGGHVSEKCARTRKLLAMCRVFSWQKN